MARRGAGAWGCGRVLGVGLGPTESGGGVFNERESGEVGCNESLLYIVIKMM